VLVDSTLTSVLDLWEAQEEEGLPSEVPSAKSSSGLLSRVVVLVLAILRS